MSGKKIFFLLVLLSALFSSCHKEKTADLTLSFAFEVDGQPLEQDARKYVNAAGNSYEVNELMYFIDDISLHKSDGSVVSKNHIHYVDADIPSTLEWDLGMVPQGEYTAISFTFGLNDGQNRSNRFVNPPECDMSWPEVMGGGYHYMKINGKWLADDGQVKPFNLHTGRGQIYDEEGNVIKFVDNSFTVKIESPFSVDKEWNKVQVVMNINKWFNARQLFDLDVWGGSIMQNQAAQEVLKQNGPYVFGLREN
jgi:hypothetical protein